MKFINQDKSGYNNNNDNDDGDDNIFILYKKIPYPSMLFVEEARKKALIMSFFVI